MVEPTEQAPSYDATILSMVKLLINDLVTESQKTTGDTERERLRNHLKFQAGEGTLHGITALSAYMSARAAERQAAATESLAKAVGKIQTAETVNTDAQAIIDGREPRRDYLASTYSLPPETLSLLWAMRGMLMDASIKSLSRPDRFDPFRKLKTEEIAWSLRMTSADLLAKLPLCSLGGIDYGVLEAFGIMHYGGTGQDPDDWMYGG